MINTNNTPKVTAYTAGAARQGEPKSEATKGFDDSFRSGPPVSFEPWLGGGGATPTPDGKPPQAPPVEGPRIPAGEIPEPTAGFEPWQQGVPTDNPNVSPKFADKLVTNLGEQAILSLDDERIDGISGYFFQGWESVGGDDFIKGRTLGRLGDQWEMTGYGTYELKGGGVEQKLSFDVGKGTTTLESSYLETRFEWTTFSETLTKDRDGNMRRYNPPVGL